MYSVLFTYNAHKLIFVGLEAGKSIENIDFGMIHALNQRFLLLQRDEEIFPRPAFTVIGAEDGCFTVVKPGNGYFLHHSVNPRSIIYDDDISIGLKSVQRV